jgi:DNA recombination protein RmuC
MGQHFGRLGDAIEKTVSTYNETVGSLERNVLSSARKFRDLHPATAGELELHAEIDMSPRRIEDAKWRAVEEVSAD